MPEEDISKYVIDSSFIIGYFMPDEQSDQVDRIFNKFEQGKIYFFAPPILPFEITNGIKSGFISKLIDIKIAYTLIEKFYRLTVALGEVDFYKTLEKSIEENLSAYDASYLVLSEKENIPLLTLDRRLQKLSQQFIS